MSQFTVSDARFVNGTPTQQSPAIHCRKDIDMERQRYEATMRHREGLYQVNFRDFDSTTNRGPVHAIFCELLLQEMHRQHRSGTHSQELRRLHFRYHRVVTQNTLQGTDPYPEALRVLGQWRWPK